MILQRHQADPARVAAALAVAALDEIACRAGEAVRDLCLADEAAAVLAAAEFDAIRESARLGICHALRACPSIPRVRAGRRVRRPTRA